MNNKYEKDSSTIIFIIVILIILASFLFFLIYVYKPNNYYAKPSTSTTTSSQNYYFEIIDINDVDISFEIEKSVNDHFKLALRKNNDKFDIVVNDKIVAVSNTLYNKVAIVDDILFIYLKGEPRQNRLIGISSDSEILINMTNIENVSGMAITDVVFNPDSINVIASRVYNNKLILSNNFGDVNGTDICNSKDVKDLLISANYELSYKGNKKFNDLVKVSGIGIKEYIEKNNLCK